MFSLRCLLPKHVWQPPVREHLNSLRQFFCVPPCHFNVRYQAWIKRDKLLYKEYLYLNRLESVAWELKIQRSEILFCFSYFSRNQEANNIKIDRNAFSLSLLHIILNRKDVKLTGLHDVFYLKGNCLSMPTNRDTTLQVKGLTDKSWKRSLWRIVDIGKRVWPQEQSNTKETPTEMLWSTSRIMTHKKMY